MTDIDHNPALRCSIKLGKSQPCQFHCLVKEPGLRDGILSCGGIENQHGFMGCAWKFLFHHPLYFLQLFHQVDLGVEAACRINNDYIKTTRFGIINGIIDD